MLCARLCGRPQKGVRKGRREALRPARRRCPASATCRSPFGPCRHGPYNSGAARCLVPSHSSHSPSPHLPTTMSNQDYYGGGYGQQQQQQYYPPQGASCPVVSCAHQRLNAVRDRASSGPGRLLPPATTTCIRRTTAGVWSAATVLPPATTARDCVSTPVCAHNYHVPGADTNHAHSQQEKSSGGGDCCACLAGACLCCCAEGVLLSC